MWRIEDTTEMFFDEQETIWLTKSEEIIAKGKPTDALYAEKIVLSIINNYIMYTCCFIT